MKRRLSTALMTIYWAVLPFAVLIMAGLGWIVVSPDVKQNANMVTPLWLSFLGSLALTLLIVWRLWTHERARKLANEQASSSEATRIAND